MRMFCNPWRTCSISFWKLAGHPSSPIGELIKWKCPLIGMVKAVRGCDSGSSFICQNPEVRFIVVKMDEFALPMSPIHSLISFMEYLLMWECWLSCLKSWTILSPWPCFLGTQKIGELYGEFDWRTNPNFSHSSRLKNKQTEWPITWRLHFRMRRLLIRNRSQKRRKFEWRKQHQSKREILLLLQDLRALTRGLPEKHQGEQNLLRRTWTNLLAEDLFHGREPRHEGRQLHLSRGCQTQKRRKCI